MATRKDTIEKLKNLTKFYKSINEHKSKHNKKVKDPSKAKPYEPLFDSEQEIKIAKAKLVLLEVDINGKK